MWRWLVLQIVYKKIADLKRYEKNNKKHPEKQLVKIVASIKEYGFKNVTIVEGGFDKWLEKKLPSVD